VAVLLSIPASAGILGVFLALTATSPARIVPALLLFFPLWVGVASASYLLATPRASAAVLSAITGAGFGLLAVLKYYGVSAV
jgi:hypothetical protein